MKNNTLLLNEIKQNEQLFQIFNTNNHIILAYLFGSVAKGKDGKLSDIDIGILLDDSLDKKQKFDLELELIHKISEILKTNKLDLIIMNDVSISLNFEIIKANTSLYRKNEIDKIDFEYKLLSKYHDRRYYEKRATEEFLMKVANERF